jgi:hypothetical protein
MSGASYQNQPSTLTITDITGTNISANQNDYVIGKMTRVNLATYNTGQNFNVKYTFSLNFTSKAAPYPGRLLFVGISDALPCRDRRNKQRASRCGRHRPHVIPPGPVRLIARPQRGGLVACRIGRGQRVVQGHVEDHRDGDCAG